MNHLPVSAQLARTINTLAAIFTVAQVGRVLERAEMVARARHARRVTSDDWDAAIALILGEEGAQP